MAEHKSSEFSNTIRRHLEGVDRDYLRPTQKEMFDCASRCCNLKGSSEEVTGCIDKCTGKFTESQNYVNSQINNYQERLQRCVNQCNDEAKDRLGARPTDAQAFKASLKKVLSTQAQALPTDEFLPYRCVAMDLWSRFHCIEEASKAFESCATGCIDKHMRLMPQFVERMRKVLESKSQP